MSSSEDSFCFRKVNKKRINVLDDTQDESENSFKTNQEITSDEESIHEASNSEYLNVVVPETESDDDNDNDNDNDNDIDNGNDDKELSINRSVKENCDNKVNRYPQTRRSMLGTRRSMKGSRTSNLTSDEDSETTDENDEQLGSDEEAVNEMEETIHEMLHLSPQTRRSMLGTRPKDLISDDESDEGSIDKTSSDVEFHDADIEALQEQFEKSTITPTLNSTRISTMGNESINGELNESSVLVTSSIKNDSNIHDDDGEPFGLSSTSMKLDSQQANHSAEIIAGLSGLSNNSIKHDTDNYHTKGTAKLSGNSIVEEKDNHQTGISGQTKSPIICLSSDEDDDVKPLNKIETNFNYPKVEVDGPMLQKTLEEEQDKLIQLERDLQQAENLYKFSSKLPDGGELIKKRLKLLRADITRKENYISHLKEASALKSSAHAEGKVKSWDELQLATKQVMPTHFGKKGLETHKQQTTLTLDRLQKLQSAIEERPNESQLCDNPSGLKAQLMLHQKYALSWLLWREKQKPRGGILADDMGLGKTLSIIALILASSELEASSSDEDDDDDDNDDDGNMKWSSKGRRDEYRGGTLVICAASLIKQWENEIKNHVKKKYLSTYVHHGPSRERRSKTLSKFDVVITTYTLAWKENPDGPLFGVKWERIVLDEAHFIRNPKGMISISCCALKGTFRWALTGTPINNSVKDLYPLLKFLKCTPFDDLQVFQKFIDISSSGGAARLNTILKPLILRRTKLQLQENGELEVALPKKNIETILFTLDKDEMNVYQRMLLYSKNMFSKFLEQREGRSLHRQALPSSRDRIERNIKIHDQFAKNLSSDGKIESFHILLIILRLRQICCHPGLIDALLEEDSANESDDASRQELNLLEELEKLNLNESEDSSDRNLVKFSSNLFKKSNPVFDLTEPSSKMKTVLELVENKILNKTDKIIVVSQWKKLLDVFSTHLANKRISFLRLDGSVQVKLRHDIVTTFNDPNSRQKVLLLSLCAGGVGLNLIGANHLVLMDPHWNPQLENQAQDRIYRFNQTKDVFIYKIICQDTIEQEIIKLQEQKVTLSKTVLGGSKPDQSASKLTIDDMKCLFGLT